VYQSYTYFEDGDGLVAKITPCFENGKGSLAAGLSNGIGFGTTELHVIRPQHRLNSRFLRFVSASSAFRNLGQAMMQGTAGQKRVPEDFVRDFRCPLPPLSEQQSIAKFLDRETAKIDALVARKRRLIELLYEQRAGVISQVVTRGVHANAQLRGSDIPSIGGVPTHWQIVPLMRLVPDDRPIMYGIVLPGPDYPGGVPIVKGGDVAPGRLRLSLVNRTAPEIEAGYARSRLRGGDIVYAIRGSIGAADVVPAELEGANLTQDAARVAVKPEVHGPWLLYVLQSGNVFSQLEAGANGATIRGINIRDLKRAKIPVPPREEQEEIARYISAEISQIDGLLLRIGDGIDRLKEYRAALITAAVTGKIDVRGEVT
jgi:type I restriction enzyme, S subunit